MIFLILNAKTLNVLWEWTWVVWTTKYIDQKRGLYYLVLVPPPRLLGMIVDYFFTTQFKKIIIIYVYK